MSNTVSRRALLIALVGTASGAAALLDERMSLAGTANLGALAPPMPVQRVADEPTGKAEYGAWGFDLTGVDLKANPGDSFYDFANGAWDARTVIPADKSRYGVFDPLRDPQERSSRDHRGRPPSPTPPPVPTAARSARSMRVHGRSADRTARRHSDRRRSRQNPRCQDQGRHRRPDGTRERRLRQQPVLRDGERGRQGPDPQHAARVAGRPWACPTATTTCETPSRTRRPSTATTSRSMLTWSAGPSAQQRAEDDRRVRDQDRRGELDPGREPRPRQDLQPDDAGGARRPMRRAFAWTA